MVNLILYHLPFIDGGLTNLVARTLFVIKHVDLPLLMNVAHLKHQLKSIDFVRLIMTLRFTGALLNGLAIHH